MSYADHVALGADVGEVRVLHRREKAMLVRFSGDREDTWIPLTAVHADSEVPRARTGILIVEYWFAKARRWR